MKSFDISSRKAPPFPSASTPPRNVFALTGRSVALDPHTHAVRADLADVRLADRVFAPHYAAPLPSLVIAVTSILAAPSPSADVIGGLQVDDAFDVLEVTSAYCWGQSRVDGIVGYVACDALRLVSTDKDGRP